MVLVSDGPLLLFVIKCLVRCCIIMCCIIINYHVLQSTYFHSELIEIEKWSHFESDFL